MRGYNSESGQSLTEYIILVGLIALVVYGIVQTLGGSIKDSFSSANDKITSMKDGWDDGGGDGGGE